MTTMTDSRAVDVLAEMRKDGGTVAEEDYTAAIDHAIARLREPAGVGAVRYDAGLLSDFGGWLQDYIRAELERAHDFYTEALEAAPQPPAEAQVWCPSCDGDGWDIESVDSFPRVRCPDCAGSGLAEHSITVNEAQAQGGGEVAFAEWLATEMPAGTVIGDPAWWAGRIARQYAKRCAPPSAPVGVEAISDEEIAEWERERGNGMTSAVGEYTPDEFWRVLDELKRLRAQQPAAVDGACGDACAHIAIERDMLKARAERLAEALREAADMLLADYPETAKRLRAALHPAAAQEEGK